MDAGGNLKHAKEFNNAIGKAFFPIPLEKVYYLGKKIKIGIMVQPPKLTSIRSAFLGCICPLAFLTDFLTCLRRSVNSLTLRRQQNRVERT